MPRTVAGVKALAAKLEKTKSTADLGNYYLTLIATPEQRQELSLYRFQAFDWPASLSQPVPVEVSVGAVLDKSVITAKRLPSIGAVYANSFKSTQGSKVMGPKSVKLPVGIAELIEAVIPNGAGVSTGVDLLLIPRGKVLYLLSFQIEGCAAGLRDPLHLDRAELQVHRLSGPGWSRTTARSFEGCRSVR